MDPITHIVSGALAGRALKDRFGTRLVYALCILAAWLPDIDNFVGLAPEAYLRHHRGITHSLVGIAVQALLLAGVFRLFGKTFTPLKTFLTALALLTTHVWLDVVTNYGTQLLAPFSQTRFQWGNVFIIDPLLTLPALALFLFSLRGGDRGRRLAILGLILFLVYPIGCRGVRGAVASALPPMLAAQGLADKPYEVTTDALSPVFWKVVVHDGDRLLVGSTTILPAMQNALAFDEFTPADPALLERLGRKVRFFATWAWFAQYPVMEDVPVPPGGEGVRAVRFKDVRFYSNAAPVRRFVGERSIPFQITAVLGPDGELVRYLYNHHSATVAYSVTN